MKDYDKNKESSYLVLKKMYRVIKFHQKGGLKRWAYIDMNTELREEAKNDFENNFFELMNNSLFGKTMINMRKHRDTKLLATETKRNYLVSEPYYRRTFFFQKIC